MTSPCIARFKSTGALELIAPGLDDPAVRPHAIEALAELGDPRAIPFLLPLRSDRTDAWEEDNHGPMLRVCDLAKSAIDKLERPSTGPAAPQPEAIATAPGFAPNAPRITPPVTSQIAAAPARRSPLAFLRSGRLWSYLPLIVLLLEVPWFLLTIFGVLFVVGDTGKVTPKLERAWSIAVAVPLLVGCALGLYEMMRRHSRRRLDFILLIVGTLACGVIAFLTMKGE